MNDYGFDASVVDAAEASRAFIDGQIAGRAGASRTTNPFPLGSVQYAEWDRGRRLIQETT